MNKQLTFLVAGLVTLIGVGVFAWKQAVGVSGTAAVSTSSVVAMSGLAEAQLTRSVSPLAHKLIGVWGAELNFGPAVRGEFTLDGRKDHWKADFAGLSVAVQREGQNVIAKMPGNTDEFRGRVRSTSDNISGQWIQPADGIVFSNSYATPVELRRVTPGVWRGEIVPLDERLSLYVSINHSGANDGSMIACIRNPEFNWFRRRIYKADFVGTKLTLINAKDPKDKFTGSFDAAQDQLTLPLVKGVPPIKLTRRAQQDAVGFYPRSSRKAEYPYRTPILPEDDGWSIGSLAGAGLDPSPISLLIQNILHADPAANPLNIQSLLIARHGKLVLEEYFYGFSSERPHDTRSAGKTFAPMLVGLAIDRGAKLAPSTPLYEQFPEYRPFANWEPRKASVQLQHLMSMTAGYNCDEDNSDDAPLNEDVMQDQDKQPDWYRYTLDAPMAHDPGGDRAYYCSAELNLTAGMAAKASHRWLPDLFFDAYARPLQFKHYYLNLQPNGEAYMGGGAYIRPRDQLKLGQLYLNGGVWNGRKIISKTWVVESLKRHARFEPRFGVDHEYGWGWHIHHLKVANSAFTEYESGGNGGQLVVIIPELDMVVGITGGAYGDFPMWGKWSTEIIPRYLITAATEAQ